MEIAEQENNKQREQNVIDKDQDDFILQIQMIPQTKKNLKQSKLTILL